MKRLLTIILALLMLLAAACSASDSIVATQSTTGEDVFDLIAVGQNPTVDQATNEELYATQTQQSDIGINSVKESIDSSEINIELQSNKEYSMVVSSLTAAIIKGDHSLWMWGDNSFGQLGTGDFEYAASPVKVLDNVSTVALDRYYSAAVLSDGSLWMWGSNRFGQLGDLSIGNEKEEYYNILCQTKPMFVMDQVKQVALGESSALIIKSDDSLWGWGQNTYGLAGDGTMSAFITPRRIVNDVRFAMCGDATYFAIKNDNSLWAWGNNASGVLGTGKNGSWDERQLAPIRILNNTDLFVISGFFGFQVASAIDFDGNLWSWGGNQEGQVGNGSVSDGMDAWERPAQITPYHIMDNIMSVSMSRVGENNNTYTLALDQDGILYSWGINTYGTLGDGTTEAKTRPTKILSNVKKMSCSQYAAAALMEDGSILGWGNISSDSETLHPTYLGDNAKDVCVFRSIIYIFKNDGTVVEYNKGNFKTIW